MRCYFPPTRIAKISQKIPSVRDDVEKLESSYITDGNIKCCIHFAKTVWKFLKNLNTELSYHLVILLQGICTQGK